MLVDGSLPSDTNLEFENLAEEANSDDTGTGCSAHSPCGESEVMLEGGKTMRSFAYHNFPVSEPRVRDAPNEVPPILSPLKVTSNDRRSVPASHGTLSSEPFSQEHIYIYIYTPHF